MKIVVDRHIPFIQECFASIGDVIGLSAEEITPDSITDADILVVRAITRVDERLLRNSSVRFIASATSGTDHIDLSVLQRRNIGFSAGSASNADSVAEYVVAALLSMAEDHHIQLEGKSIGIIGVGNIGSRVARKAQALGMRTLLNDPPLWRVSRDPEYLPLEALFECDFISVHTPLTLEGEDRTYHLCDRRFFRSLKEGIFFINTSRGVVVESDALFEAIGREKLQGAALDVWANEPNIDLQLLSAVDVGTPHIAGHALDGRVRGMLMTFQAACVFFGLEQTYKDVVDSLPVEQKGREVHVGNDGRAEQDVISELVQRACPIRRDDAALRKITGLPESERAHYYEALRKNYPVRREFPMQHVILDQSGQKLEFMLRGIGYTVSRS